MKFEDVRIGLSLTFYHECYDAPVGFPEGVVVEWCDDEFIVVFVKSANRYYRFRRDTGVCDIGAHIGILIYPDELPGKDVPYIWEYGKGSNY